MSLNSVLDLVLVLIFLVLDVCRAPDINLAAQRPYLILDVAHRGESTMVRFKELPEFEGIRLEPPFSSIAGLAKPLNRWPLAIVVDDGFSSPDVAGLGCTGILCMTWSEIV